MSRTALLELVRSRLGLDASSLGERVVDDACADARRSLGVADDEALYRRVLLDLDAFAEVAEHFVVPESWFFRASEQLDDLVRFAREHPQRRPLRVLSLPCASGEEAYSAAMVLLDAGLTPDDIDVLGIDVSRLAVQRAQSGQYRRGALRGAPLPGDWAHASADGFVLEPTVRRCARFRTGNALDPQLLRSEDSFDVVFCRNLLIYLHAEARARLLDTVLEALAPGGLVLAGQAEVLSNFHDAFQPYPGGCPLSYVRRSPPGEPALPAATTTTMATRSSKVPAARRNADPPPPRPLPTVAAATRAPAAGADASALPLDAVAEARRLADAGHLDEARRACLAHLSRQPADVPALYLLGLLESAAGDAEAAERAFTRVLYLDRNHLEALEQRVGLAERRGQAAQARELRARVARLRQRVAT